MLKLLFQKFFKKNIKKSTLNWAARVDNWIKEDYSTY